MGGAAFTVNTETMDPTKDVLDFTTITMISLCRRPDHVDFRELLFNFINSI